MPAFDDEMSTSSGLNVSRIIQDEVILLRRGRIEEFSEVEEDTKVRTVYMRCVKRGQLRPQYSVH
jgi:hypothetical protein